MILHNLPTWKPHAPSCKCKFADSWFSTLGLRNSYEAITWKMKLSLKKEAKNRRHQNQLIKRSKLYDVKSPDASLPYTSQFCRMIILRQPLKTAKTFNQFFAAFMALTTINELPELEHRNTPPYLLYPSTSRLLYVTKLVSCQWLAKALMPSCKQLFIVMGPTYLRHWSTSLQFQNYLTLFRLIEANLWKFPAITVELYRIYLIIVPLTTSISPLGWWKRW